MWGLACRVLRSQSATFLSLERDDPRVLTPGAAAARLRPAS
jgi:hypothetical protein